MMVIENFLLGCYLLSLAAITRNLIKIKLTNDFEEELKKYREYDLSTEQIKIGADNLENGKFIVLIKVKAAEDKIPYLAHTLHYANIIDTARLF